MKCPVCKNHEDVAINLHSDGFAACIFECTCCESIWSVNDGATRIVKDTQKHSFLNVVAESVEQYDYDFAA